MKAYNTHQILYAKNFYAHSGDIIADMRKVCKLDNPDWNFTNPTQILKFMSKQYVIWLDSTPEVEKEEHPKVAWESDPIKAEIWSILIAYSCYVPMTSIHGYISELPRYDVLKPQYNVGIYHVMDNIFEGCRTSEECTNKVKEILNMSNTEIMDIIADRLMHDFKFNRAAKVLEYFGENVTAEELDDELWTAYSELVGYNLQEDGTIVEKCLHSKTKHFALLISPKFGNNTTMDFDVNLVPCRWEVMSDEIITPENFREQYFKCCDKLIAMAKTDFTKISELCSTVFNEDSEQFQEYTWEAPEHLHSACKVVNTAKEVLHDYIEHECFKFGYDKFSGIDEYSCLGLESGCFGSTICNENGKMRVTLEFHTLYETCCYANSLHNYGSRFIDDANY